MVWGLVLLGTGSHRAERPAGPCQRQYVRCGIAERDGGRTAGDYRLPAKLRLLLPLPVRLLQKRPSPAVLGMPCLANKFSLKESPVFYKSTGLSICIWEVLRSTLYLHLTEVEVKLFVSDPLPIFA